MSIKPIGVLDSGVGGLTVVKELMRQLPQENIIYYGDTAHCPYGVRELSEVRDFTFRIIQFLIEQGVKIIVIACNTATAASLDEAKRIFDIPIIGVIQPGVRAAIAATENERIGIIGTEATINSNVYEKTLRKINPNMFVVNQACQPFVSLVEQNLIYTNDARRLVAEYLQPLKEQQIDTLVLGCTHYPLMSTAISMFMGPDVELISSAAETARETIAVLYNNDLLNENNIYDNYKQENYKHENHIVKDDDGRNEPMQLSKYKFYVSGAVRPFAEIGSRWLGMKLDVETKDIF